MQITGKVTQLLDYKIGTDKNNNTWKKQDFTVETDEKYNNLYFFSLFGAELVEYFYNQVKVGDTVKVDFNVKTNHYEGKYYTNLIAWRVVNTNP